MLGTIIEPEIRALIDDRNFSALRKVFVEWSPADLADMIQDLPEDERVIVFRVLPQGLAADVFEYLDFDAQQYLLKAMGHEEAVKVLNEMSPDDRTALLEDLPSNVVTQLLRLLTPEERKTAQTLLNYPEDSVGRLMTPDFIAVRESWTVKDVLDFIREHGRDSETLNVIYVVDAQGKLIDDIRIREFLLRPFDCKVSEMRAEVFVALTVTDPQTEAIDIFKKYDRSTLPVLDGDGMLVGIVTIDDVLDVIEEETTEDIQKIGGTEALDEPYDTISMRRMIMKRAPWLVILFVSEMFTTTAMGHFEADITKLAVLAIFIPLMLSSGGNSGSQATTLVIRAMALGQVQLRDWFRIMGREMMIGVLLGVILGAVGFFRISLWHYLDLSGLHWFHTDYKGHPFLIAFTVSISLVGTVCWGSLIGTMLPFVLRLCKMDPATSSSPFVATLVDVTGIFIYFTIAGLLMPGLLR